jgi:DNA primase catalytic core
MQGTTGNNLAAVKKFAVDIVAVIEQYIPLRKSGKYYRALCPFHSEKSPSFFVNADRQTFNCYGCDAHGDVVDFIQQYKKLSFKDALADIGLDASNLPKPDSREMRKREAIRKFRAQCDKYHSDICTLIRTIWRAKQRCKTEADIEAIAYYYHKESTWNDHLDILEDGTDEQRYQLFREVCNDFF